MSVLITNGNSVVLVQGFVYSKILESQSIGVPYRFKGYLTERNEDGSLATVDCVSGEWALLNC